MSPTLRSATVRRILTDLGTTADSIQWWEPGVVMADGVSCWERVTGADSQRPEVAA